MKTTYAYFKNSNTGELIELQRFTETIINYPDNFYDIRGKHIAEEYDLTGFVEIGEKKYNRYKRKLLKL